MVSLKVEGRVHTSLVWYGWTQPWSNDPAGAVYLGWSEPGLREAKRLDSGPLENRCLDPFASELSLPESQQGSFLICHFLCRCLEEEKLADCDEQNECQGARLGVMTNINTFGWSSVSSESAVSRSTTSLLQVASLEIRVSLLSCVVWPWSRMLLPPLCYYPRQMETRMKIITRWKNLWGIYLYTHLPTYHFCAQDSCLQFLVYFYLCDKLKTVYPARIRRAPRMRTTRCQHTLILGKPTV